MRIFIMTLGALSAAAVLALALTDTAARAQCCAPRGNPTSCSPC